MSIALQSTEIRDLRDACVEPAAGGKSAYDTFPDAKRVWFGNRGRQQPWRSESTPSAECNPIPDAIRADTKLIVPADIRGIREDAEPIIYVHVAVQFDGVTLAIRPAPMCELLRFASLFSTGDGARSVAVQNQQESRLDASLGNQDHAPSLSFSMELLLRHSCVLLPLPVLAGDSWRALS